MTRARHHVFLAAVTFGTAWLGVVAYSYLVLGRLEPTTDEASGLTVPPALSGVAINGEKVYAANGCVSCHTQQVRPAYLSSDIEKGLGPRRTVARDFQNYQPAALGYLRIGPDLANYGLRAPGVNELHRRLYDPREVEPNSLMPSYRYLYTVRKISGQQAQDAVTGLTGPQAPPTGYEVVPTAQARELVAYLLSLKRDYSLPEAPLKTEEKK